MKKTKTPVVSLNLDRLSQYYALGRDIADLTKKRNELRTLLMDSLDAGKRIASDARKAFICEINEYEKESIPWQSEADRRADIARQIAKDAGFNPKQLKALDRKLTPNYPKVPVRSLEVKPRKDGGTPESN